MKRRELLASSLLPFFLSTSEWKEMPLSSTQRSVEFGQDWTYDSSTFTWINYRKKLYLRDKTLNKWAGRANLRCSLTTRKYVEGGWECHEPTGDMIVDLVYKP
jgi:hypothetical protein